MPRHAVAEQIQDERAAVAGNEVGLRIRAARQERGLSLSKLGGKQLSKSFLSLVESGRSQISLRSLRIIADRMELPVSYFLDETGSIEGGELALDRAEAALLRQEPAEALQILDDARVSESRRVRMFLLRGWALIDAGRARDAISELHQGLSLAESRDDSRLRVQLRYMLGKALYNLDNYEEALVYFRDALPEAMHEVQDPALIGKITVSIGHILYITGNLDSAIEHYARARDLFGSLSDLQTLGAVYSGLSLAYEKKGDPRNALHYSKLSLGAFEARQNARQAAREINNMAVRYKELGDLNRALECAREAVARAHEVNATDVEALAYSTLALVHLTLGDTETAAQEAGVAEQLAPNDTHLARIDAWLVLADLAERKGQHDRADKLYGRALEALTQIGHHSTYADAAAAYSLALRKRGDTERALQYALNALDAVHATPARSG